MRAGAFITSLLVGLSGCVCGQNGVSSDTVPVDGNGTYRVTVEYVEGMLVPSDFVLSVETNNFRAVEAKMVTMVLSRDGVEIGRDSALLPQVLDPDASRCESPCIYEAEITVAIDDLRELQLSAGSADVSAYECVDTFARVTVDEV